MDDAEVVLAAIAAGGLGVWVDAVVEAKNSEPFESVVMKSTMLVLSGSVLSGLRAVAVSKGAGLDGAAMFGNAEVAAACFTSPQLHLHCIRTSALMERNAVRTASTWASSLSPPGWSQMMAHDG